MDRELNGDALIADLLENQRAERKYNEERERRCQKVDCVVEVVGGKIFLVLPGDLPAHEFGVKLGRAKNAKTKRLFPE